MVGICTASRQVSICRLFVVLINDVVKCGRLVDIYDFMHMQWLEHLTGDQKVIGSIPVRDSERFSDWNSLRA